MVRYGRALAASACLALLAACGSGGDESPAAVAKSEIGPAAGQAEPLPSGSLQTRILELRNSGTASATDISVTLKPDANLFHLPLICEGAQAQRCKTRADGGIDVAELPVGTVISLSQRLRVKPGFSGDISNDWNLVSAGGVSGNWRQALQAYAADVSVAVQPPVASTEAGVAVLSYEVLLSNAGPDEARDVEWQQLAAPSMTWLGAACSASGGAVCPAAISETLKLARVPKGASVRLMAKYGTAGTLQTRGFLSSELRAAGDAVPGNDRAIVKQPDAMPGDGSFVAMASNGQSYQAALSLFSQPAFRVSKQGYEAQAYLAVGVDGGMTLAPREWTELQIQPWFGGLHLAPGMALGSFDFGQGLRPFVAAASFVTSLAELEGRSFTLFGAKADKDGKPTDAFVWAARVEAGKMRLCASDTPKPLDQCELSAIKSFELAMVGTELELMSAAESVRVRVARTQFSLVLMQSRQDAATGASEFWLGLPTDEQAALRPSRGFGSGVDTLASPQSVPVSRYLVKDSPSSDALVLTQHLANREFIQSGAGVRTCIAKGTVVRTAFPGLYKGQVEGFNGQELCYGGEVYYAQSDDFTVILGAKGSSLMGRWLFVVVN